MKYVSKLLLIVFGLLIFLLNSCKKNSSTDYLTNDKMQTISLEQKVKAFLQTRNENSKAQNKSSKKFVIDLDYSSLTLRNNMVFGFITNSTISNRTEDKKIKKVVFIFKQ